MIHGVLVVDKPGGLSSHDVVARVRRVAGQRGVGHAGTLDPMATGVLVVLLGEATKLASHLTADDKVYRAAIRLGSATDTLDAQGTTTGQMPVPELSASQLRRAVEAFLGPQRQRAPAVSAVKVNGRALYERVRRGEVVEPPVRDVRMRFFDHLRYADGRVELRVGVAKGYYVRSFARDLGTALGTCAHLEGLRREASGRLHLDSAIGLDDVLAEGGRDRLEAAILSPARAVSHLPQVALTAVGAQHAFHGRLIRDGDFDPTHASSSGLLALIEPSGRLTALGRRHSDTALRVIRGFRYD